MPSKLGSGKRSVIGLMIASFMMMLAPTTAQAVTDDPTRLYAATGSVISKNVAQPQVASSWVRSAHTLAITEDGRSCQNISRNHRRCTAVVAAGAGRSVFITAHMKRKFPLAAWYGTWESYGVIIQGRRAAVRNMRLYSDEPWGEGPWDLVCSQYNPRGRWSHGVYYVERNCPQVTTTYLRLTAKVMQNGRWYWINKVLRIV